MKILFLMQGLGHGGAERAVSYVGLGLTERGHRVAACVLNVLEPGGEDIFDSKGLPARILFQHLPGNMLSSAGQIFTAIRVLRRWLQEERFDIFCCTGGLSAMLVSLFASFRLPQVHLVWQVQGTVPPRGTYRMNWRMRLVAPLIQQMSSRVQLLISCSAATDEGVRRFGLGCKKQVVIYNAVDTELYQPDAAGGAAIRKLWDITPEKKLVGLVARLDPIKGHKIFLQAASLLAAKRSDLMFVCVGGVGDTSAEYRSSLHQMGEELGLNGRLLWTGPWSYQDMRRVYNALDVLCLSSYSEGIPNVLLEAMACGVPCVATCAGGVPEVIGDRGIVVPVGDASALAQGVLATLANRPDAVALRQRVIQRFGIETMISEHEREFESIN